MHINILLINTQDLREIVPRLSQNVVNYSISVNGDGTNISTLRACSNTSTECSFPYPIQTSPVSTDSSIVVNVIAFNIVGGGPVSTCHLPTMNISKYS